MRLKIALTFDEALLVMGLDRSATKQDIKKRFRELSFKTHPDKVPPEKREEATIDFKWISLAKEILLGAKPGKSEINSWRNRHQKTKSAPPPNPSNRGVGQDGVGQDVLEIITRLANQFHKKVVQRNGAVGFEVVPNTTAIVIEKNPNGSYLVKNIMLKDWSVTLSRSIEKRIIESTLRLFLEQWDTLPIVEVSKVIAKIAKELLLRPFQDKDKNFGIELSEYVALVVKDSPSKIIPYFVQLISRINGTIIDTEGCTLTDLEDTVRQNIASYQRKPNRYDTLAGKPKPEPKSQEKPKDDFIDAASQELINRVQSIPNWGKSKFLNSLVDRLKTNGKIQRVEFERLDEILYVISLIEKVKRLSPFPKNLVNLNVATKMLSAIQTRLVMGAGKMTPDQMKYIDTVEDALAA